MTEELQKQINELGEQIAPMVAKREETERFKFHNHNGFNSGLIDGSDITNSENWTDDTAADAAQATADTKISSFYQSGIPTALAAGDIWIDTDDGKIYRATAAGDDAIGGGEWIRIDNITIHELTASDTLEESADTERNRDTDAFILVKEIYIRLGGTIRVKFDIKGDTASFAPAVEARIYINGVAKGTLRTSGDDSYETTSEDFNVSAYDKIQLYYKGNGTNFCYIRNFRIYYTKSTTTNETTVNTN